MRNSLFGLLCTAAAFLFAGHAQRAEACTNLIVGKKASADGSVIVTYSADNYGLYGTLRRFPAAHHPKGTKRRIVDGDTNHYLGEIDEAPETYSVIGNINEFQVTIGETTFGGRAELTDPEGIIDYVSLMSLGLQRAKTAREAIRVMTSLVEQYGYASSGESFTIADPDEAWIMEMIGKGPGRKGAVWVAVRVPDDCISAHANQSRIRQFNRKDKQNVMCSEDVISFASEKGYFDGKDSEFDFAAAYSPTDFGMQRYCEARVWSFFNRWADGMDRYLDYAAGKPISESCQPMPLFVKPNKKLSVHDVMMSMRDHYEGTPFDTQKDIGAGPYDAPYRPTPLSWKVDGKEYFNERPISTQQSGFTFVSQMRSWLPDAIGGVLWFGNDDANTTPYTPIYCCTTNVPECFAEGTANDVTFSWESAFWVCNWVANMTYPRYSALFPDVEARRDRIEARLLGEQDEVEARAAALLKTSPDSCKAFLDTYTNRMSRKMLREWRRLGEYLIVKHNDQVVKPEKNGRFTLTEDGLATPPERPGYPERYNRAIVRETGDRYLVPQKK